MRIARAAAVCLVLLAPAVAFAGDDVRALVDDLGGRDAARRSAAFRTLVEAQDPAALPLLRDAIPGWDDVGRTYGLRAIDAYPPRQARRTWTALARCDVPFVRLWAANALRLAGEKGQEGVVAEALHAPDVTPTERIRMLDQLGWPDEPSLRESIRALLAPTADLAVLVRVVSTLHRAGDRDAVPALEALLATADPDRRGLAAALLYDLGRVEQAAVVASCIRRRMGTAALAEVVAILSPDRRVTDEILDAATGRLGGERDPRRLLLLIGLVGAHRHLGARNALRDLLGHGNAAVSRAAFDVLVRLSGPLQEDTLRPLLGGPDPGKRLWAAEALRRRDDLSGLPVVVEVAKTGTVPLRRQAVALLASFTTDEAVEPLIDALVDDHLDVRRAAVSSLARLIGRLFPYRTVDLGLVGYHPEVEERERHAAAQRMRAWWGSARRADW